MDWIWILFRFKGRLNRARYLVVQLALLAIWFMVFPNNVSSPWKIAVTIAIIWINTATTVKRLHDRNKSGFWLIPILIVHRLFYLYYGLFLGLYFGVDISSAKGLLLVMVAVAWSLLATWIFIELIFLIGSDGPNRFGADPLARVVTGAPTDTRSGQHPIPAFLVHGAGPSPAAPGQ
jgi:uncharacterized membrane protein YhaH (DUF805 family)